MKGLEDTIVFEAKRLLPTISQAVEELETKKTEAAKRELERFRRWQEVLEAWQNKEVPTEINAQRFEKLRDLLIWDREKYE